MNERGNTSGGRGVDDPVDGDRDPAERPSPVVMKFGGSSVADLDRLRHVAAFIVERAQHQPVVVVVSAMGKTTDGLVEQARALCDTPSQREMDMLLTTGERISMALMSLAIHGRGVEAISLTGSQCGIITDHQHGRARIMEVRPFRILDELAAGHIVIVGGFQGVSYKREVTTLGRGGSDTTAVALAAALAADCEIYSDVDGVYSADPRTVEGASRIEALDHAQMRALSRAGAKVLHARAVELAEESGIAIYARATPSAGPTGGGETIVRRNVPRAPGVSAVACDPAVVDVCVRVEDDRAGNDHVASLAGDLGRFGLRYLSVDGRGASAILSTTQRDDAEAVLEGLATRIASSTGLTLSLRRGLALVTCVGGGLEDMVELPETAGRLLAEADIAVQGLRVDANSMAFLVAAEHAELATQTLHAALAKPSRER